MPEYLCQWCLRIFFEEPDLGLCHECADMFKRRGWYVGRRDRRHLCLVLKEKGKPRV